MLTDRIFIGDEATYGRNKLQGFDDFACLWLGIGTQIDGFAHVAVNGRHYHGLPSNEVIRPRGARHYGIEQVRPLVGRGILLDMTLLNNGEALGAATAITPADLEAVAVREGVRIERGDIVLLHTTVWMAIGPKDWAPRRSGAGIRIVRFTDSLLRGPPRRM